MTTTPPDVGVDELDEFERDATSGTGPSTSAAAAPRLHPTPPPRRAGAVAGTVVTVIGALLVGLVVFELLVTPIVHAREQRDLAGELRERLGVAAALAEGVTPAGTDQFQAVDLGAEQPPVPELSGELAASAVERLETEGHTVRIVTEPSREWIAGIVVRTVPEGGTPAAPDSEITLVVATVEAGSPVAALRIDRLGIDEVVVEGTSATQLSAGPGHYRGSPMPGEAGNAVLAGHRTLYGGPFRDVGQLTDGDEIVVTTTSGVFTYRVRETRILGEGSADVFEATDDNRLTLVTSNPEYGSSERLVVVADLQGEPVTRAKDDASAGGTTEAVVIAPDELARSGDPTAWGPLLVALELLIAALVLAAVLYRRWHRWTVWLLTTPIVIATAFLFYESLTRLFPATL